MTDLIFLFFNQPYIYTYIINDFLKLLDVDFKAVRLASGVKFDWALVNTGYDMILILKTPFRL